MEVILTVDMPNLGKAGDIVRVRDGYSRNYLIPQKLALPADKKNIQQLEHNKKVIAAKEAKRLKEVQKVAELLNGKSVTIAKSVGEEGKIFGSVTPREVASMLKKDGINIDHRMIDMSKPIKEIGEYEIPVRLHSEVLVSVKLWIVKE